MRLICIITRCSMPKKKLQTVFVISSCLLSGQLIMQKYSRASLPFLGDDRSFACHFHLPVPFSLPLSTETYAKSRPSRKQIFKPSFRSNWGLLAGRMSFWANQKTQSEKDLDSERRPLFNLDLTDRKAAASAADVLRLKIGSSNDGSLILARVYCLST